MDPYLSDVLDLLLRFLHVVAGIAWIGASFYFIRLDLGLRPPRQAKEGVAGEYWGVHGGGFYHSQKYLLAPRELPEPLHWFKWEAYTTWLSGFSLLVVLYYFDADTRLVDPQVADIETWQAIAVSAGSLAVGWVVYDLLCRIVRSDLVVALAVAGLAVLAAWGMWQLLAPRAAYLQVGAILGTIMAANVLFSIIPAHRELIRARETGRDPDPAPGIAANRRSVHNNYLTLPVVFTMVAGHFPLTFGHERGWLVLVAIAAITVAVRHFFNLWHRELRAYWILAAAALAAIALAVEIRPPDEEEAVAAPDPARVDAIVRERCAPCHSGASPPLGIRLTTREEIQARAHAIERVAVDSRTMPPGNTTGMTDEERDVLAAWVASR